MAATLGRAVALLLTVCTGFSGLVYEVTWQKYLAILLGSHSEATAAILGLFLAGLSLGYALFGAVTRRRVARAGAGPARLLLLYAAVEGAIGLWALGFPWLFEGVRRLSLAVPSGAGGASFALDVALTALLVGPPTILMGGTIPILTQALARDLPEATRVHAWVYAFNTAGAFAGALAAGFWLVPQLGLALTLAAMGAVNLGAALVFAALEAAGARPAPLPPAAAPPAAPPAGAWGFAAVAALCGFAMMVVQTVVIRIGGLALGSSPFTFAMVVAVFVLCIALGSMAVSLLPSVRPALLLGAQWLLVACVALLYPRLEEAPYWAHVLRVRYGVSEADFYPFFRASFLGLLAALGPAVFLSGAVLPLLFHHARRGAGELGDVAGRLYAWNTAGSLLGALLGGYALLFWLDLHAVFRIAVAALIAGAALSSLLLYGRPARTAAAVFAGVGGASLLLFEPWDPALLTAGLFRHRTPVPGLAEGPLAAARSVRSGAQLAFYDDDPTATVSVNEWHRPELVRSLQNNGKSDGSTTGDYPTMALAGVIPALLAERAERAFVIGWGTGVTAGELAALGSMREVVVAEISSGVLAAAPLFDFASLGASHHPKIRVIRSDAYRALLRSRQRFDVIVSEPSNPWMTGVEMLYSREFLAAAKQHLAPGGVYAQWYHQYETDPASLSLVLRTYAAVFDHVAVWYGASADLFLLGFDAPGSALDLARLERRAAQPELKAAFARSGVAGVAGLLAHEILPLGVVHALRLEGPIHTLTHPLLSFQAARAFFSGRSAALPFSGFGEAARVGAAHSLLGRHLRDAAPAERSRRLGEAALEACRHRGSACVALLAGWRHYDPAAPPLDELLKGRMRESLFGGGVDPAKVEAVAGLLGPPDAGPLTLEQTRQRTDLFRVFHHHALPFDAARVLDLWERCSDDEAEPGGCARGRELLARLLAEAAGTS
jgi:predicted membrane-bound spermidine synthase